MTTTRRCPHCFSVIDSEKCHMGCSNERCTRGREVDIERCALLGVDPDGPNAVITRYHIVRDGKVCDICGSPLRMRLCPKCHHRISMKMSVDNLKTVMFLAPHNCGLSHYMTSLVKVMYNIAKNEFNGTFKPADSTVRDCMEKQYFCYINNGLVIPSSKSPPEPMVYSLSCGKNGDLTLIFVDVACDGYGMPKLDRGSDIEGMILDSSGIILLVDPESEKTTKASMNILSHITDLYKDSDRIDKFGNISVPLAVTLAKIDLLSTGEKPLLGPWSAINIGRLPGTVDDISFGQIDVEIREIVKRLSGEYMMELTDSYKENMFFAVSAIGYNPVDGHLSNGIEPFRVEDPLIWLLGRNNYE